MNGNDKITVETRLNWNLSGNDRQYRYLVQHNDIQYTLIRNHEAKKWYGLKTINGSLEILPVPACLVVNELVLQVEELLFKNT